MFSRAKVSLPVERDLYMLVLVLDVTRARVPPQYQRSRILYAPDCLGMWCGSNPAQPFKKPCSSHGCVTIPSKELKAMIFMCIVTRNNKKFASFNMELSMRIDLRSSRSYLTTAMVAVALLVAGLVATPANAWADDVALTDDHVSSADVSSAIANTAELTDGLVQAPVDSAPTDTAAAVAVLPSGVTVEVPFDASAGVKITGNDGDSVTISMPETGSASTGQRLTDGTIAYPSDTAAANAVIPNMNGVQLLTMIANSDAATDYSYRFTVPADTSLEDRGDYFLLVSSSEGTQGIIQPAWAKDANGRNIPTSYTWAGGVLTQHVEHTSVGDITYPVTADPGYGYSIKYPMNGSPNDVKWVLKTPGEFARAFPVAGAPANFPMVGQVLPLHMGWCNGEVRMRSESTQYHYFGWDFLTTENHIDGPGSLVVFEFRESDYGLRFMQVSAWVNQPKNSHNDWLFDQQLAAAHRIWALFASNINWGLNKDADEFCPGIWPGVYQK